jgi:hypothetical protein
MKNVFRKRSRMTYLESNDFWVVSEWFYVWYNGITPKITMVEPWDNYRKSMV